MIRVNVWKLYISCKYSIIFEKLFLHFMFHILTAYKNYFYLIHVEFLKFTNVYTCVQCIIITLQT
jgi:hypothetical protein